jgi:hypothetical protein
MFKVIYTTSELAAYAGSSSAPLKAVGSLAGASLRIQNYTRYGVSVYWSQEKIDYIAPYQFLIIENDASYYLQLDEFPSSDFVHPLSLISVRSIDEKKPYEMGILIQTVVSAPGDTIQVAGDMTISNTPQVTIEGAMDVNIQGTPEVRLSGDGNSVNIGNTPNVVIAGEVTTNISNTSIPIENAEGSTLNIAGQVNIGNTPQVTVGNTVNTNITSGTVNATIQNAQINSQVVNTAQNPVPTVQQANYGNGSDGAYVATPIVLESIPFTSNTARITLGSGYTQAITINSSGMTFAAANAFYYNQNLTNVYGSGTWNNGFQMTFKLSSAGDQGFIIGADTNGFLATNARTRLMFAVSVSSLQIIRCTNQNWNNPAVYDSLGIAYMPTLANGTEVTLYLMGDLDTGSFTMTLYQGAGLTGIPLATISVTDSNTLPTLGSNSFRFGFFGAAGTVAKDFKWMYPYSALWGTSGQPSIWNFTSFTVTEGAFVQPRGTPAYTVIFVQGDVNIDGLLRSGYGAPGIASPPQIELFGKSIQIAKGGAGGNGGVGYNTSNSTVWHNGGAGGAATNYCSGGGGGGTGGGSGNSAYGGGGGGTGSGRGGDGASYGGYTGGAGGAAYPGLAWHSFMDTTVTPNVAISGVTGGYGSSTDGGNGTWGKQYGNGALIIVAGGNINVTGTINCQGGNGGLGGYHIGSNGYMGYGANSGGEGGGSLTLYTQGKVNVTSPGSINVNGGIGWGGLHAAGSNQCGNGGGIGSIAYIQYGGAVSG